MVKELDKIILQSLRFYSFHGVMAEEKVNGQWFEVDLEIWGDFSKAAGSDNIDEALDYSNIYQRVKEIMEGRSHNLLESVNLAILNRILELPLVQKALVRVKKLHPPVGGPAAYAGVEMVRQKNND